MHNDNNGDKVDDKNEKIEKNEKIIEIIDEWFENHTISILNIYILSLIIIEQNYVKDKKDKINSMINLILDILFEKGKEINKEEILKDIENELETLEEIGKLTLELSNNPDLLQKNKFVNSKNETTKLIYCRRNSMSSFSVGHIKN